MNKPAIRSFYYVEEEGYLLYFSTPTVEYRKQSDLPQVKTQPSVVSEEEIVYQIDFCYILVFRVIFFENMKELFLSNGFLVASTYHNPLHKFNARSLFKTYPLLLTHKFNEHPVCSS
jgi:hypothetical protein